MIILAALIMINTRRLPKQSPGRIGCHPHMIKMQHYQYQHPKSSYILPELLVLSATLV